MSGSPQGALYTPRVPPRGAPDTSAPRSDTGTEAAVRPAPRRRLTAEARREQIISAARGVFIRTGLAGTRTRDIAAAAGINEALLYRHFASKEEIFEAAVAAPLQHAIANLAANSGDPPAEFDATGTEMHARTRRFIRDLLDAMDEIAPLLGISLFGDADAASRYYRDRIAPSLDAVRDIIIANMPAWNHRPFDPTLVVEIVFGVTWFTATTDHLTGHQRDREAYAEELTRVVLNGIT